MPWKVTTIMEQKIEFICECRTGKYTITELCANFEISRPAPFSGCYDTIHLALATFESTLENNL